MSRLPWTPWHEVVKLRDDVKTGELSLQMFAADLYDVVMGKAKPVYQDPAEFFTLTYPTVNLRELAKDVVGRLAAKNDKAVRQLELTYGGGKTHTLIALYHLTHRPDDLPNLPAVQEFVQHIGFRPPATRIAVLPFDKLDVQRGMEIAAPNGSQRWLKHPWNVLAFQIAGQEGLDTLGSGEMERDTPPAENLLTDLLRMPAQSGLASLVLIDELLMYAREKVMQDAGWRAKIVDFFQYLTQAATKVDRCAIVASLLATDPRKSDELGKEIQQEIYAIFGRLAERSVVPVAKDDVAEVIRRRFFTPESIRDKSLFRQHAIAAVDGIAKLDDQVQRERNTTEERFEANYPFDPDFTDVLYTKWTQLEGFQRTRGLLRTFALALRGAYTWDESPVISSAAFLVAPTSGTDLSDAARELTKIATTEEYEGRRHDWASILEGELEKAKEIEAEFPGLKYRELEQCVFSTFLHSQPIGQKATTRDLLALVGGTRPDKIDLQKALLRWAQTSWFLDEDALGEAAAGPSAGAEKMPTSWRLGSKPNLKQMHHDACRDITDDDIDSTVVTEIGNERSLVEGAQGSGAIVHRLPQSPADVKDDGAFHYVVLGARASSESGKPSAEAGRYLTEYTGPDNPRTYCNSLLIVTPSRDGILAAKEAVRSHLGWRRVQSQLKGKLDDPVREARLRKYLDSSAVQQAVRNAYSIVVDLSKNGTPEAFKVTPSGDSLFTVIVQDKRSRVQRTPVNPEALLPGGPYKLWHEGETTRWVRDVISLFAQSPEFPRLLSPKALLDTLAEGCRQGLFVLSLHRPDGSTRTLWREAPDEVTLRESGLEVILPAAAELTQIHPSLLEPDALPGLWQGPNLKVSDVIEYFATRRKITIHHQSYVEGILVPMAPRAVVEQAIAAAVQVGSLWLTTTNAGFCAEEIPAGLVSDDSVLHKPPQSISPLDILPAALPDAWKNDVTSAAAIAAALSRKANLPLPWLWIRRSLDGAFQAGYLERTADSGVWPSDFGGAGVVRIRTRDAKAVSIMPQLPLRFVAQAQLDADELQDLAARATELVRAAAGFGLKFTVSAELSEDSVPPDSVVAELRRILQQISPKLT